MCDVIKFKYDSKGPCKGLKYNIAYSLNSHILPEYVAFSFCPWRPSTDVATATFGTGDVSGHPSWGNDDFGASPWTLYPF